MNYFLCETKKKKKCNKYDKFEKCTKLELLQIKKKVYIYIGTSFFQINTQYMYYVYHCYK